MEEHQHILEHSAASHIYHCVLRIFFLICFFSYKTTTTTTTASIVFVLLLLCCYWQRLLMTKRLVANTNQPPDKKSGPSWNDFKSILVPLLLMFSVIWGISFLISRLLLPLSLLLLFWHGSTPFSVFHCGIWPWNLVKGMRLPHTIAVEDDFSSHRRLHQCILTPCSRFLLPEAFPAAGPLAQLPSLQGK